jgi:hypothetical protein
MTAPMAEIALLLVMVVVPRKSPTTPGLLACLVRYLSAILTKDLLG